jgi:hypothetical protein
MGAGNCKAAPSTGHFRTRKGRIRPQSCCVSQRRKDPSGRATTSEAPHFRHFETIFGIEFSKMAVLENRSSALSAAAGTMG